MITIVIILNLFVLVLLLSKVVSKKGRLKNHKKYVPPEIPIENPKKAALNSPGYYEDILNKGKLKRAYKWELHESF